MSDTATVEQGIDAAASPRESGANVSAMFRLRTGLKGHFGPEAAAFVDPVLWLIGCVCVDIVRLDYWLQKRNPDYGENESMRLFIRRKYGSKAERFVKYWIKGEARCAAPQNHGVTK